VNYFLYHVVQAASRKYQSNEVERSTDIPVDRRRALLLVGSLVYGGSQQMGPERNT
jgi:hypothetical protein